MDYLGNITLTGQVRSTMSNGQGSGVLLQHGCTKPYSYTLCCPPPYNPLHHITKTLFPTTSICTKHQFTSTPSNI